MALFGVIRLWAREGRLTRRAVIVGGGDLGEALIKQFREQRGSDVRIVGLFDDRNDERSPDTIGGQRKLGIVDDLLEFARRTRVDLVIFSLPISAETRILQMLQKLGCCRSTSAWPPTPISCSFRPQTYSYLGSVPVLDVFDRPIADWDVVMKWLFDKIVGGLILLAAAPVMAAVALAIKLDSRGPVLFRQKRYGFNNELIEVYKFRSMYTDMADENASSSSPRMIRA
jgi:hypothetical protein